jgi:hypothetical protein
VALELHLCLALVKVLRRGLDLRLLEDKFGRGRWPPQVKRGEEVHVNVRAARQGHVARQGDLACGNPGACAEEKSADNADN